MRYIAVRLAQSGDRLTVVENSDHAAPVYPFTAFSFAVEIYRGEESSPLVHAAFAECEGLEMTHEVKTIRQGGDNTARSG